MNFVPLLNLPSSSSVCNSNWRPIETMSTPGSAVVGRDEDRDYIVKLLRENHSESTSNAKCYSVHGIWGMGGSGKTTLAQYVFEHEKEAKYFDCFLWAHVSGKFSVHAIFRTILESLGEPCLNLSSLEALQSKLEKILRGKMFFLVLDDVWCDKGVSELEFEQLYAPLRAGKRGSKILVTTRIKEAAKALGDMNPIPLRELDDEHFFSLFMSNALGDAQIKDNRLNEQLTLIGRKIATKLCRSPLAAKTVASHLRIRLELDPKSWSSMLDASLLNDTMGALLLSYQYLPPPLQRCFAFCSLFPKGHSFRPANLVELWIAEGFIETDDSNKPIKDIATRYFWELTSCSFFQVNKSDSSSYSLHDLMHDLAQHVSQGECFVIDSNEKKEIPTQTRHMHVALDMLEEYMERICKLKYLCTIVVQTSLSNLCLKKVDIEALFMKSQKLCVVLIQACIVQRVPESVVHLRNLRYLDMVPIQSDGTHNLLNRLYHLRFLSTGSQIPEVGRLILLQNLAQFRVRTTTGFELKQLEHLKCLSGSLSIYGLHHVESQDEAYRANLSDKNALDKLLFSWDYESRDVSRDIDVEILEGLCPPPQIKDLAIKGYSGKSFPSWISENNDSIIHLEHFELANCLRLESLHVINELSNLLSLTISFLPRLKSWFHSPSNLTRIDISHCLSLGFVLREDIEMITSSRSTQISQIVNFVENSQNSNVYTTVDFQFERVQEMLNLGDLTDQQTDSTISTDLKKCLEKRLDLICQLKDVCDSLFLSPALEKLSIKSCLVTDKILARSFEDLTSLTHLILEDIITITCMPKEVLNSLKNLMTLDISGCLFLRSIEGWDTHSALDEFYVACCPNLILEPLATENIKGKTKHGILKKIMFSACIPPNDMHNLVFLETLWVCDCPTLLNLHVGCLKTLVDLIVRCCPNLVSLRGLRELTHLKFLDVVGCQKLESYSNTDKMLQPNKLYISRLSLVKGLISREGLSSLVSLNLHDELQENLSQEELEMLHGLSSLEEIDFYRCNIRTLPTLSYLHSLKYLTLSYCVNLTSLPVLPPSVELVTVVGCNDKFTKSCKDASHPNCQKLSRVPEKYIR